MVESTGAPYRIIQLSAKVWQALLCSPNVTLAPSVQELQGHYPLSSSPTGSLMGWAVAGRDNQPLAAVWTVLERPSQWRLVWATQPGEALANEALLGHLSQQAQRLGVCHWSCAVDLNDTVLSGFLKAHGFRHVATQSHWQSVAGQTALHSNNKTNTKEPIMPLLPLLRLAQFADAWPVFHLAQEACPVHARPYLMPWPPTWQHVTWQACQRFLTGKYERQWVLERPNTLKPLLEKPALLGSACVQSSQYPWFTAQVCLSDGWQDGTDALVSHVLNHILQQAHQPIVYWQSYSHQKQLENSLTTRGFDVIHRQLLLVRDVWTPLTPEKSHGLSDLLLPPEPLYGSAHGKPC